MMTSVDSLENIELNFRWGLLLFQKNCYLSFQNASLQGAGKFTEQQLLVVA